MVILKIGQDLLIHAHGNVLYYIHVNMINKWIISFNC